MEKANIEVLRKILYAVESGGQIYGNQNYAAFIGAGANCSNEKAITIGAGQWYAGEAKRLLQKIQRMNPAQFKKMDTQGLESDLLKNSWATYAISANSAKAKCIVSIINSELGRKCQDELMDEQIAEYAVSIEKTYGAMADDGMMECINIIHQGGSAALKRILAKTAKPYTAKTIYAALCTDPADPRANQVGDYTTRQKKVYEFITKYADFGSTEQKGETTMTIKLSNCGHDENGRYAGGKAGDQTGTEYQIMPWYSRPWLCVLRFEDSAIAAMIDDMATKAAKNDLIGYDQGTAGNSNDRYTFWQHLKASNYDPAQITVACESDCSASTAAIVKGAGHRLNNTKLKNVSIYLTTYNMRSALRAAGAILLTDKKYLVSAQYLKPGDILLNDDHHVAIAVSGTASTTAGTTTATGSLKNYLAKGDTGGTVKTMQTMLIAVGYSCGSYGADGSFGSSTDAALRKFQKDNGLAVDGQYGPASEQKLKALYNAKKLKDSGSGSGTPSKTPKWVGSVNTAELNVRTGAGTSNPKLAAYPLLKQHNLVDVCDATQAADGTDWYYIRIAGKYFAYVAAKYISKV